MNFDFSIRSELDPEYVCEQFGIELEDFYRLIEGKRNIDSDKTILFVIEQFLEHIKKTVGFAENTKRYYQTFLNKLNQFLKENYSGIKISSLNSDIFHEFLATCKSRNNTFVKNGTINTYVGILRSMLEFAYEQKYVTDDLREKLKFVKNDLLPRHLPKDMITALLEEAKKTSWPFLNYTIIYFMLMTGCRISEVIRLRIKDFNINENVIFIRKSKNEKERYVPMYPELKEAVLDYFSRTGLHQWSFKNEEALFTKRCIEKRNPLTIRSVQYMLDKIYTKLGIKGMYTVHSLRSTFAVNCIKMSMPIEILQQILGHKSIETTRVYIQLLPEDLKEEVMKKYPFPYENLLNHVFGIGRSNEQNEPF